MWQSVTPKPFCMALLLSVLEIFAIICMKKLNMAEYVVLHNHSMIYAFCSMHSHDRMCWPRIELRVSNFGKLDEKNLEHVIVPAFPNPSLSLSLSSNLFPKYALSNNHLFPYPAPMHSQASFKIKNHHDHYLSQRASKCIQFHSIFSQHFGTPISWDRTISSSMWARQSAQQHVACYSFPNGRSRAFSVIAFLLFARWSGFVLWIWFCQS